MGGHALLKTLSILTTIFSLLQTSSAHNHRNSSFKTEVFLSPKIVLEPGVVSNKIYLGIDFPRGHIGLKSVNAEIVDEAGQSVPLHEVYLHHWLLHRYYAPPNNTNSTQTRGTVINNGGVCGVHSPLTQYFGFGAETRRTDTDIPYPYAIEVGVPGSISAGLEEGWYFNVHVIDTRGTVDRMRCTECWCGLYNVTTEEDGRALPEGYMGGIKCCRDGLKCRMKAGFVGEKRSLYLRYTVTYAEWDATWMVPAKVYVLDVTDVVSKEGVHNCGVEYDVERCGRGEDKNGCVHSRRTDVSLGNGGYLIYGVGHIHTGGLATAVHGQGGREVCSSYPIYGKGKEAGDEAGYIVGMSTCYPSPDRPVKISPGETLTLVSKYSNTRSHAGVMGLFYLLLADEPLRPNAP